MSPSSKNQKNKKLIKNMLNAKQDILNISLILFMVIMNTMKNTFTHIQYVCFNQNKR